MAQRRRTPWVWLIVAALLLAGGAWLMRGAEPPSREAPNPVRLPTRMNEAENQRADDRRTWVPMLEADAGVMTVPPPARDPVLAIMPSEVKRGAVVAEFNAIVIDGSKVNGTDGQSGRGKLTVPWKKDSVRPFVSLVVADQSNRRSDQIETDALAKLNFPRQAHVHRKKSVRYTAVAS